MNKLGYSHGEKKANTRGVALGDYGPDGPEMPQGKVSGRAPVFCYECVLSAQGKVTGKVEIGPLGRNRFTYAYDDAGHLTELRKNEMLEEYYLFDEDGRRVQDFRSWAGERRNLTYKYDGTLIQAGNAKLEWTNKGQLSSMVRAGKNINFFYGRDSRLDRAMLADGTDVRYFYERELLPIKITMNGNTVAEYQWREFLRLERCRSEGLDYAFVYEQGRAPVRVTVSGTAETVYRATGIHSRQVSLNVFTDPD